MKPKVVLDASALLALIKQEPGSEKVSRSLDQACMSAINFSEVLGWHTRQGLHLEVIKEYLSPLQIPIFDFDPAQAELVAELIPQTQSLGLSFADRACIALALTQKCSILTADKSWEKLKLPVKIEVLR